jgi:hypothetical protein
MQGKLCLRSAGCPCKVGQTPAGRCAHLHLQQATCWLRGLELLDCAPSLDERFPSPNLSLTGDCVSHSKWHFHARSFAGLPMCRPPLRQLCFARRDLDCSSQASAATPDTVAFAYVQPAAGLPYLAAKTISRRSNVARATSISLTCMSQAGCHATRRSSRVTTMLPARPPYQQSALAYLAR